MSQDRVVVAGGGVAGLVAARHLADADLDVTLYEAQPTVGGRVRSTRRDGYVFDNGFQVLFTAYPAARRELDYDALDLRTYAPGAVIAGENSRSLLADPFREPRALVESALNPEVTLGDKYRIVRLRQELAATPVADIFDGPDTSIANYLVSRGFSTRFVENFAAPFYGGITLDRSLSTSKKVFEFTFKMLASGHTAVPADGMGELSRQLADRARSAGAEIVTDATVTGVDAGDGDVTVSLPGRDVSADAAVVATDPQTARELTDVAAIPTEARGCVTQYFSIPGDRDLGVGKHLVLNTDSDAPNQVAPVSAVAPEQAPDDRTLFSATYLGDRPESDGELASLTQQAMRSWFPEHDLSALELVHTERIPFAQFAQPPGIHADLPANRAPEGPVYLAGDFTEASSINGAMESGRKAARAVRADLQE